jgi:hypothetical protein
MPLFSLAIRYEPLLTDMPPDADIRPRRHFLLRAAMPTYRRHIMPDVLPRRHFHQMPVLRAAAAFAVTISSIFQRQRYAFTASSEDTFLDMPMPFAATILLPWLPTPPHYYEEPDMPFMSPPRLFLAATRRCRRRAVHISAASCCFQRLLVACRRRFCRCRRRFMLVAASRVGFAASLALP